MPLEQRYHPLHPLQRPLRMFNYSCKHCVVSVNAQIERHEPLQDAVL